MRTEQITKVYYQFNELSEEAKKHAVENLSDLNTDRDWWEYVYEDAMNIGLKITGFDIQYRDITGNFDLSACEVAQNVINNHGETCETYKTAQNFLNDWQPVFNNYMDESHPDYESNESEEKLQDLESEFEKSLLEDYLQILTKDYEYLESEEAIIETIECNEYEFDEAGNLQ